MSDAFDPYFKWLGIPKADQPPNAYRLLGIELFESDVDVISNAADGRMAQLKSFQTGKYGAISQKLLNEIAAAKVCLLKPEKKAEYDRRLQAHLQQKSAAASTAVESPPVATVIATADDGSGGLSFLNETPAPKRSATRPVAKAKSSAWLVPAGIGFVVIAAAAGVAAYIAMSGDGKDTPDRHVVASNDGNHSIPASSAGEAAPKPSGITALPAKDSGHVAAPRSTAEPPNPARGTDAEPTSHSETASGPETPEPDQTPLKSSAEEGNDAKHSSQPTKTPEPVRKPHAPDEKQYQAMKSKILKIYQKEFSEAKTAPAKLTLAMKLDKEGDGSNSDPAERYSLWRLAAEGAIVASEFSTAMEIVDKIQADFNTDADALKGDLLKAGAERSTLPPEAARELCETAMKLAATAVAREDFETATRFTKLATATVRRTKDPQYSRDLMARNREIEHLKGRYALVAKAIDTLTTNADNPEANLLVGQWVCCVKGDWEKGLPHLAKGSREELAALAKLELAKPSGAKEQVALADAWSALADKDRSDYKSSYQARAVVWWEQALPNLSGLEKTRVEKLIASTNSRAAAEVRAHPLPQKGMQQQGNVASASNGATVTGPTVDASIMLGDTIAPGHASQAQAPCEFIVTLDKPYLLRQVRILFYAEGAYPYAVFLSRDGRKFDLLEDHSKEKLKGWQDLRFSSRAAKALKIVFPQNEGWAEIAKFEAYCYPLDANGGSRPRTARGPKQN